VRPVAHAFQRSPQRSACRLSIALHLTARTVRRILLQDLKFHPFKIQAVQQLVERDLKQRSDCWRKWTVLDSVQGCALPPMQLTSVILS
jgi:hypothetical protein